MPKQFEDPLLQRIHELIRNEVDPEFDFVAPGPIPWRRPPDRLATASIALLTTAGLHLREDRPFRALDDPFGDASFRVIPHGTPPERLDLAIGYVDQRHIPQDPEVALPQRALESLHRAGLIGPPAPRHLSVSGGIVRPLPGLNDTAAQMATLLQQDGVAAVALAPSCPLCVQTVCLLARGLETRGLATVCLTLLPELTRIVGAPRSLRVRFRFGAPCGDPGNAPLHRAVLQELCDLLAEATEPGVLRESNLLWKQALPRSAGD